MSDPAANREEEMVTKRIVVIGGGITGLAAAHHLLELARARSQEVALVLLEARGRLGGTIATQQVDGFTIEAGPDSFLSEKPWARELCDRLGLTDQLVGTDERYRRTSIVSRGCLHPLPDGFQLLAPTRLWPFFTSSLFSWPGKLRMALDLTLPRRRESGDESLGSFVRRRLGEEALERVAQPLVAGIYTADPDRLSLAATMPRFLEAERRHRSLILALWRAARSAGREGRHSGGPRFSLFMTCREGMEVLVRALADRLPPESVRLKQSVRQILHQGETYAVSCEDGTVISGDAVIVATEAHRAAAMLEPLDPELAGMLGTIPYASSATVSLGYRRAEIEHPLDGFGFVVPASEGTRLLACTFSSVKYPRRAPEGYALLRAFVGGALGVRNLEDDDKALVDAVERDLRPLIGLRGRPVLTRVYRHDRAMPQYEVGHLEKVSAIEARVRSFQGLALAGGAYRGVGIADCIYSGERAAAAVLDPG